MATMTLETPNGGMTKAGVRAILRDLKAKSARIAEQARATAETDVIELLRLEGQMEIVTGQIRQMIDLYRKLPE